MLITRAPFCSTGALRVRVADTFHMAGVGSAHLTIGVPRFKALIDLSHVAGSMTLVLREPRSEARAREVARALMYTRLSDVVASTAFLLDPDGTALEADELLLRTTRVVYGDPPADVGAECARMVLDKERMRERGLTPRDLYSALLRVVPEVHWCASETNALEWVLRMRVVGEERILEAAHAAAMAAHVCGVRSVASAWVAEAEISESPGVAHASWVVQTSGLALQRAALLDSVDIYKSTINDVNEAYRMFGIEVCAVVLFREIQMCITHDGSYIDPRHLAHVTNTMCFRAEPMSFTRHGISARLPRSPPRHPVFFRLLCACAADRVEQSALLQSSFEETEKLISDAAMFSKTDAGRGITQSVIFGQTACVGTGKFATRAPALEAPPPAPRVEAAPPARLCKSRVRKTEAAAVEVPRVEFVDSRVWRPRGTGAAPAPRREHHYAPPSP